MSEIPIENRFLNFVNMYNILYVCLICVLTDFRGALYRQLSDFNAAIDDYLVAMDKTDHDYSNNVYKEAQRQLLLCYNDFAVECFR